MSHIAIDARELRTSSGRYVERLLHYLQDIDTQNDYTVLLKPKDIAGWQQHNPRFIKVECDHKEFSFDEQIGFLKQLNELNADLLHFAFPQQPIRYSGRTITTVHDLTTLRFTNPDKNPIVFKIKQQIYANVINRAVHKSDAVLTGSQFVKDDVVVAMKVDPAKITVTLEAADAISDQPEAVAGLEKTQFLMYVGRPTPHKNLGRLIESFSLLKSRHPKLKLVLAGKKDANYDRIAANLSDTDIVFTGFVSEGQLRWLYEHCAAYVFPSLSEGFGLPGLEAMVHGAPVVSSNATCLPEIYGQGAHYFDPNNTQNMTDAINEILTDKKLRQQLVENGTVRVKEFSWYRMAEQTLAVYKHTLNAKNTL